MTQVLPAPDLDLDQPTLVDRLRLQLVTSAGLDDIPAPEPIVDDVLYVDSLAWLIGPPGNGKSFVALDMAGCVATGETWQGYPTTRGRVVYLCAEGVSGVRQRVRAWEAATGRPMGDVYFLPVAVQAANAIHWQALVELLAELRPALVVIDTQARVTVGMEENSAKDMGEFVQRVEQARIATKACVLIVHHQGRNGDHMRGSTAMEGAATTIIKVTKDDAILTVECTKQKDAPEFDALRLRLVPYESSAIVSLTDAGPSVPTSQPAVRQMLADWWNQHETDWVSVTTLVDTKVCTKATFHRNKKALMRDGILNSDGEGKSIRYRLTREPSVS